MPAFDALGVPAKILSALDAMGYHEPTPVQTQAIPPLLAGKDALVEAQTGSGKTTAFGVPTVVVGSGGPGLRAIVLVPTRELARQVAEEIRTLGTGSPFRGVAVTGGVQAEQEERTIGGDVRCIVATPGRLLALLEQKKVKFDRVELVVLDEADRMLDMGFQTDVELLLDATAHRKQTALVSATLPHDVVKLAEKHLRDPIHVRATSRALPPSLAHHRLNVFEDDKERALVALLKKEDPQRAILFVKTRDRATRIAKILKHMGFAADALQGDMSHDQRRHVFELFSTGVSRILVATDLASRGLDVPEMELVVNYDLSKEDGAYTHRAGRAARLGRPGRVVSLVEPDEKELRIRLERETGGEWAPYRLSAAEIEAIKIPDEATVKRAAPKKRPPPKREAPPTTRAAPPKRTTPKRPATKPASRAKPSSRPARAPTRGASERKGGKLPPKRGTQGAGSKRPTRSGGDAKRRRE